MYLIDNGLVLDGLGSAGKLNRESTQTIRAVGTRQTSGQLYLQCRVGLPQLTGTDGAYDARF